MNPIIPAAANLQEFFQKRKWRFCIIGGVADDVGLAKIDAFAPLALVTSGGGEQMACDNVEKGVFQEEIAYHVMDIGRDLNDVIQVILESGLPAGKEKIVIYSPTTKITKETLRPGLCWSVKNLEK